jgi:hypothetical protein
LTNNQKVVCEAKNRSTAEIKTTDKQKNYDRITHAYAHLAADVHFGSFAPAFTLSLCDSERSRKPPMPIASGVRRKCKKNKNT